MPRHDPPHESAPATSPAPRPATDFEVVSREPIDPDAYTTVNVPVPLEEQRFLCTETFRPRQWLEDGNGRIVGTKSEISVALRTRFDVTQTRTQRVLKSAVAAATAAAVPGRELVEEVEVVRRRVLRDPISGAVVAESAQSDAPSKSRVRVEERGQ